MIEPGRCIVAEAGYTLYTVGFTKKTDNKEFLFIDGGMADNIRPALYGSKYYAILANKEKEKLTKKYEVAGKCCESGDVIIHDCKLPNAKTGDLLLVFTTGAYGSTMSSNYNMLNKLPVVFVKNGKDRLVVRRETYKDQCQRDLD
jgi:diaminopimelate decarboxylase